jgi:hypothetical protein
MIAYLDPGTLSMLLAALAGGVAAIAVVFRSFWHRFLGLFPGRRRKAADEISRPQTNDDDKN